MKLLRLSLLLMIPALVSAQPVAVKVFSLSPYFESGKTNTFLVSIKNCGTNNIPIPSGLKMDNGIIIPTKPSIGGQVIGLTNGIPFNHGTFGSCGTGPTSIDMEVLTQALKNSTHDEVMDQLYGKHYLKPQDKITYKISYVFDPRHSAFRPHNTVMVTLYIDFRGYDIEVTPISLYQKKNRTRSSSLL